MDVDEVAEQPHRGNGVPEMTIKYLQKNKKSDNCVQFSGVHPLYARVAQWWSIALPRRGSRVRIPSRALKLEFSSFFYEKEF